MLRQLYPYYKRACRGKKIWKKIRKEYEIDRFTQIVIMPEGEKKLNKTAMEYMPYMLERRSARRAVIIKPKQDIADVFNGYETLKSQYCYLPPGEIENLLHYYEMYVFSPNVSIISYTKPNGNTLYKFIGRKGINTTDAVCLGMYCLRHIPEGTHAYDV